MKKIFEWIKAKLNIRSVVRRPRQRRYFYLDKTYLVSSPVICSAQHFESILNYAKCYEFYNDPEKGIVYICEKVPQNSIFGLVWIEIKKD